MLLYTLQFCPVGGSKQIMVQDLRAKIYPYISDVLPFCAAFLIVPMPASASVARIVFEKFLIALFLLVSWQSLRNLFYLMREKPKAGFADYISILFMAIVTPVMLQVLKYRISDAHFYGIIIGSKIPGRVMNIPFEVGGK